MSKDLSNAWLEEEDVIEEDETVFGGNSESPYIQGYSVQDVKITMAKRKLSTKAGSKTEWIVLDFINKEGKTLTEEFMVKGANGKSFSTKTGKKVQLHGTNKIKSLIKVVGLYTPDDNLMKELYSNTEEADVTYTEYGKEKTEEFTVFSDLIGKKAKVCITSKKVNATTSKDQDDEDEQKYVNQCVKDTKAYIKANPKKKSLAKYAKDNYINYPNIYKWFTETYVSHFCSTDGLFGSEIGGEGGMLQDFLDANDEGLIFEARTLIPDDMTEAQLKKLGINQWGKRVEPESDDDYEEPTEGESESDDEDDWE